MYNTYVMNCLRILFSACARKNTSKIMYNEYQTIARLVTRLHSFDSPQNWPIIVDKIDIDDGQLMSHFEKFLHAVTLWT